MALEARETNRYLDKVAIPKRSRESRAASRSLQISPIFQVFVEYLKKARLARKGR
jgi:hypothetical protein